MIKVILFIQLLATLLLVYMNGFENVRLEKEIKGLYKSSLNLGQDVNTKDSLLKEKEKLLEIISQKDKEISKLIQVIEDSKEDKRDMQSKLELLTKDVNHFMTISKLDATNLELIVQQLKLNLPKPIKSDCKESEESRQLKSELNQCLSKNKLLQDWYNKYKKELSK